MAIRVALAGLAFVVALLAGWQIAPVSRAPSRLDRPAAIVPIAASTPDDATPAGDGAQGERLAGSATDGAADTDLDSAANAPSRSVPAAPDATGPAGATGGTGAGGLFRSTAPIRVPRPVVPPGPRRVGLQVGHWQTDQVPDELHRLEIQTGTSWGGVAEWQVNLDVANRVAAILRADGYAVDVLPTTIPPGYLADAFVALHADGGTDLSARGYKAAHGARRGPYEDLLVQDIVAEYGRVTGLPLDSRVTRNMLGYYAFSWTRYKSTVAPHTPAAILEMGFLTNAADRTMLLQRPDLIATGVAGGIRRFLADVPAGAAFADDLTVLPAPFPPLLPSGAVNG